MAGFTVAVHVDHLPAASLPSTPHAPRHHPNLLLIPNCNPHGTVSSTLKNFIRQHLFLPDDLQLLTAPLFTALLEHENVEDIYNRYSCHADAENPDLHVDEETFAFFGQERGQSVHLRDEDRLDERHVIDQCQIHLKRLPQCLSEAGSRIFVETKDGILPLLGVHPGTPVSEIKKTLEFMTGIPVAQQLLSSVGRVMHDEFLMEDFDGLHAVYQDGTLDLCKSGDTNAEQAHRRMVVQISVNNEQEFALIVQGRTSVLSVMQVVESRTGHAQWQQRLMFSGKVLDEKKALADFFIYPECTLQVNVFKKSLKLPFRTASSDQQEQSGQSMDGDRKPAARKLKLVRTCKGVIKGTLTIPVLTTDTVYDLKRKIKRSLQPLRERNLSTHSSIKEQTHIDITPRSSPATMGSLRSSRNLSSPSPSTDYGKSSAGNLLSSVQSRSVDSPTRITRSPLSTTTSCQASPLVSGLPRRAVPTPSSLPSNLESIRRQLEELPSGNATKPKSFRRLQFESLVQTSPNLAKGENRCKTTEASMTTCEVDDHLMQDSGSKLEKRSIGSWINGGVQILKDQIRAQFAEN